MKRHHLKSYKTAAWTYPQFVQDHRAGDFIPEYRKKWRTLGCSMSARKSEKCQASDKKDLFIFPVRVFELNGERAVHNLR
jgi:hypothetical protein